MTGLMLGYGLQFVLLIITIGMVTRSRKAMNGLARGLILLGLLLMVRRVDDVGHLYSLNLLDETVTMVLSLSVTIVFFVDVRTIDKIRDLYAQWHAQRRLKIAMLESKREQSERMNNWDQDGALAKQTQYVTHKKRANG